MSGLFAAFRKCSKTKEEFSVSYYGVESEQMYAISQLNVFGLIDLFCPAQPDQKVVSLTLNKVISCSDGRYYTHFK